jgi:hypothetical protein
LNKFRRNLIKYSENLSNPWSNLINVKRIGIQQRDNLNKGRGNLNKVNEFYQARENRKKPRAISAKFGVV